MALVSPITAALLVPYANRLGAPFKLETIEDMLMMLPPPRASMAGKNARQVRYIDVTFMSKESSQSSEVQPKMSPGWT